MFLILLGYLLKQNVIQLDKKKKERSYTRESK